MFTSLVVDMMLVTPLNTVATVTSGITSFVTMSAIAADDMAIAPIQTFNLAIV